MNSLMRAYSVLLIILATGAVAAWYVLWHVTCNNSVLATDGTEGTHIMWANLLGISLGVVGGYVFTLMAPKKQFVHALLFAVVATCIGFALLGLTRYITYQPERFDAFTEWTHKRNIDWFANSFFWITFWISEGIYYWLLPQLVAQLLTVALVQQVIRRKRNREWSSTLME